jgi:hypothetical protein
VSGVTYDAGMLVAAEGNERRAWLMHRRFTDKGLVPTVPVVVLAQVWRGGPQPLLSRLLAGCWIEPLEGDLGRDAGKACGKAGTSDVVDAIVVVGALGRDDVVVTSDLDDLRRVAHALRRRIDLCRI